MEPDNTTGSIMNPIYNSWILNTESFSWEAPVPYPTGDATGSYTGSYQWDEDTTNWVTSSISI